MFSKQLKELTEQRKKLAAEANGILTKAGDEKNRRLTGDEQEQFEKRHTDIAALNTQMELIEKQVKLEDQLGQVRMDGRKAGFEDIKHKRTAGGSEDELGDDRDKIEAAHYRTFLRGGQVSEADRQMIESYNSEEYRALSALAANGTQGSVMIPNAQMQSLEQAVKFYGGIVDAATTFPTDTGAPFPWPTENDTGNAGEQTAENTGFGVATDPAFGVVNFNAYNLDSIIVKVPFQLLQDSAFNVEEYVNGKLAERIGRLLNNKATLGSGTNTLTGVVVASTAGPTAAAAAAVSYNDLIELEYSVDRAYRNNPKVGFMMHDSTLKVLRKLTDTAGRPLWMPGGFTDGIVRNREPDTLNGYPVWANNDMATLAINAKSILFGDFSKFKIRRVNSMLMIRLNELYAASGQVGFLAYQRFDSNLVDAGTHPIKYLLQPAS